MYGFNNENRQWEICKAKEGNKGRYGCHHADHEDITKDEAMSRNETLLASAEHPSGLSKSVGNDDLYAGYTKEHVHELSALLDAQYKREYDGESLNGSENVRAYPSSIFRDENTFLYSSDDTLSKRIYDSIHNVSSNEGLHDILNTTLPKGAKVLAYIAANKNGVQVDLDKKEAMTMLNDICEVRSSTRISNNTWSSYDAFDNHKDLFNDNDLLSTASSSRDSRYNSMVEGSVKELIHRGKEQLIIDRINAGDKDLARNCLMVEHQALYHKDQWDTLVTSRGLLNAALRSAHGNYSNSVSEQTRYYDTILRAGVIDDDVADMVASDAVERLAKSDLSVGESSTMRTKVIMGYATRKNPDDRVMGSLFAHGDFSSAEIDDEWRYEYGDASTPEYEMNENDIHALVYGAKHHYLDGDRIIQLASKDLDKASLFVESSANRSLTPEVRKQLRSMLKKVSRFSKF